MLASAREAGVVDLTGQIVDAKYRVDHPLGRGGMGAVFRATHLGTDRTVALKVIHPSLAGDPAYVERFRREARACGRLRHANIVDVTDFGVCAHGDGQLAYLVMEYLDGCTLAEVLQDEPVPPLAWTIDILEQVCAAVEEAHRQGILHRDLKPENVWLEPNRRGGYSVKVLDFGLAKFGDGPAHASAPGNAAPSRAAGPRANAEADARDSAETIAIGATVAPVRPVAEDPDAAEERTLAPLADEALRTSIAGTPGYMSPEQATGGEVTARTDVYSLGVIAFRMLTGREPFVGTIGEVMHAHVHTPPPSIRDLQPGVSLDAAELVMAALAKDPAARPESAGRFGNMLAGRLEPPGASYRHALTLVADRLPVFLTIATAGLLPALVWSTGLTIWAGVSAVSAVPPPAGWLAVAPLAIFVLLIMTGVFAAGVMPVAVLHAMAAPDRPIDLRALRGAYELRVRAWMSGMWPIVWPQLAAFVVMLAGMGTAMALVPWIRSFAPAARAGVLAAFILPGMAMWVWAIARLGASLQGAGFLGAVMLVEGLPFEAARRRAVALAANAGRRQRRGRYVLMIALAMAGLVVGLSAGRVTAYEMATIAPLIAVGFTLGITVLAVVSAMGYFNARRAMGESIDGALEDFERALLPETHWRRSHRERVMGHLSGGHASGAETVAAPEAETKER